MTRSIVKDTLINGGRFQKTKDGAEITRVALVSGATGSGDAKLACAAAALGLIGSTHPYLTSLRLVSLTSQADDSGPGYVRVEGNYRGGFDQVTVQNGSATSGATTVDIAASLRSVQTEVDYKGSAIRATYAGSAQGGSVSKLVPNIVVNYRQIEDGPPDTSLLGKTNSGAWTAPGTTISGNKGEWLCTNIQSTHSSTVDTYYTTYSFEKNTGGNGWNAQVRFVDPKTGKSHRSASAQSVTIYTSANYALFVIGDTL